ncbi:MAG: hypothetical protein K0R31_1604 [Clostridiales bacterium]|nr:hypothetical protein [Clostridiales bacterium]
MPFDGIVAKAIVKELHNTLEGARVEKIFQPESDEIILQVRAQSQNLRLLLSASANYPRIHFTENTKENPSAPPVFCMLLRKHLSGGRVVGIEFHDYERIISLLVESTNELGDLSIKKLMIEIMGRHSNIILVNAEDKIIDSIKHVDNEISRVREIMPARPYVLPPAQNKTSPDLLDIDAFIEDAKNTSSLNIEKYMLDNIKGFSPLLCREVCSLAELDGKLPLSNLKDTDSMRLKHVLANIIESIRENRFSPCIVYEEEKLSSPVDFHALEMKQYPYVCSMPSMNKTLDSFYSSKDKFERLKQKKSDILKVLNNSFDRCNKKLSLQQEKLRDVSDREKLKLYGELITANIYCIPANVKSISLLNYYSESGEMLDVPMDDTLSPQDNAQRYFKKYAKAKSTYSYTSKQVQESLNELEYLESVLQLLENCATTQEIDEVRQELAEQGYLTIKRKPSKKSKPQLSAPMHFKSSDGLDIYVGKNNKQNDVLTLKTSSSNDIWLHTKDIPGSHVIIKKPQNDIPDTTLLEAAHLAAYFSKAKQSSNVQVDYAQVRNVKKPSGAKPGMVIYENYRTLVVTPDENIIKKLG